MIFESAEFWVAVAFVLFVTGAFRPMKRILLGALDRRAEKIRAELDEAQRLREDAQHTLAEYQRKQRQALKEADEIVARAREEADRHRAHAARDLEATLKRREAQAMDRVAQAEAQAVEEVQDIAITIAVAATRKLLSESLDEERAGALTDKAIKELPKKLH